MSGRVDWDTGNRRAAPTLTHERLCELLEIDPNNGLIKWRVKRGRAKLHWNKGTLHRIAKTIDYGYYVVTIDKHEYRISHIIWFYFTKFWPPEEIDHHDGNAMNNKFDNLRSATDQQNTFNRGPWGKYPKGVSLLQGVRKKKWKVCASIKGVKTYIGSYENLEEASLAYQTVAEAEQGSFSFHNRNNK